MAEDVYVYTETMRGCNNNNNRKKYRKTSLFHDTVLVFVILVCSFKEKLQLNFLFKMFRCAAHTYYMRLHRKMYYKCIRYRKRNAVNSLRIFLSAWTVNVYIAFRRFFIMLFQNRGENCKIIIIYCVAKKKEKLCEQKLRRRYSSMQNYCFMCREFRW